MIHYCPNCNPELALDIAPDTSGEYSIAFGDNRRVESVTMCGGDVTRRTFACRAGKEGKVDVYVEPLMPCAECGTEMMREVLSGNVVVTLKEAVNERSS